MGPLTVCQKWSECVFYRTRPLNKGLFARQRSRITGRVKLLWYYCIVMARITFSLDDATVAQIRQTAARLKTPQSHVVREAVADYAARTDRLSERERQQMMGVLERLRDAKPTRPAAEVDEEIRDIRSARRAGGRRHEAR